MRVTIAGIVTRPSPSASRIWRSRMSRGAVSGVDPMDVEVEETPERGQVVAEVPVVGGDDSRRPAQDHVAREERLLLDEVEAEVVGGVAGRVDGGERGTVAVHGLPLAPVDIPGDRAV